MDMIRAGINIEIKDINEESRTLTMIGSNELIDRDQEVLSSDGWDLKNFKKNPVILFAHDHRQPPVAKANKVWVEDSKLMFKIEFPKAGDYPFADTIYKLYKGGFMNASSVGFMPKEWVDGTGEKNSPLRTYTKQELLELSLVPVPANPQAIVTSKSLHEAWKKNVISEKEWDSFSKTVKSLFQKEPQERIDELEEQVKQYITKVNQLSETINSLQSECKRIEAETKRIESETKKVFSELQDKNYLDALLTPVPAKTATAPIGIKEAAELIKAQN